MIDSAERLGLSDSDFKRICSTQQAQDSILYMVTRMEEEYFRLVDKATTFEELLYTKAYAAILRKLRSKLLNTRKDMEAKARVQRDSRTRLPFPTD